jgi:predicted RNA-binding protein with PUA-like domain
VAQWILKEEPEHYAWADLLRDGRTEWDGVHNALALRNLKAMRPGDRAIFYHTGTERACVGIVEVVSDPHPDPTDDRGSWSVEVRPVRALARPIPLSELKSDRKLAGFDLVRFGRLSVVAASDEHWERLLRYETPGVAPSRATGPANARARAGARRVRPRAARRKR